MVYIFWTAANREEAEKIVRHLLEKRLIACASLFPHVESWFRWEGKIEQAVEVKAILKTRKEQFEAVSSLIQKECSYQVPEITEVAVEKVSPRYLKWLEEETS